MKLNRRKFLVGAAGATVALPALESWLGKRAMAGGEDRPRFAVWVRAGNGVAQQWNTEPEQFWPTTTGALTTALMSEGENANRATSELAPYASRLNLLKGVNRPFGTVACGHSESIPQCLTGARCTEGSGNTPQAQGVSADWAIARAMNPAGREPLTLMAGPGSAFIAEALSWSAPNTRTPAERSPLNAYMRMMGLSTAPPEIQVRIAERRTSVNDLVRDQMQSLLGRTDISARDRTRLEQHFDAIRDTEIRMSCDIDPDIAAGFAIDNPQANDVRPEVVRRHMELVAFAFSCDITRAATIQVGEGNDQTQYEFGGSRLPRFHWISHRIYADGSEGEAIPNAVELHHQVDRLQLQMFRHLLDQLDQYPSAYGGTLLDDSVATWLNDLGNGPPHSGDNVPWLLAGSAGGFLRTGQYLDLGRTPINRVLNTIISAVGVRKEDGSLVDDFGDSSVTGGLVDQIVRPA